MVLGHVEEPAPERFEDAPVVIDLQDFDDVDRHPPTPPPQQQQHQQHQQQHHQQQQHPPSPLTNDDTASVSTASSPWSFYDDLGPNYA
uniref:Uncharacterized protein n=1 Tax=Panagrolaimus superbus TaxID=310955 RepID=A0A914XV20_9BILA